MTASHFVVALGRTLGRLSEPGSNTVELRGSGSRNVGSGALRGCVGLFRVKNQIPWRAANTVLPGPVPAHLNDRRVEADEEEEGIRWRVEQEQGGN